MIDALIPRELQQKVDRELEHQEMVEWVGMPIPGFFTGRNAGLFLTGTICTAGAIYWMAKVSDFKMPDFSEGSDFFALFGLIFVGVGLKFYLGPFFEYRAALKTVYVITNQRAITFDGGRSTVIRSYPPNELQGVHRKEDSDGSGDVILTLREWRDSEGDRRSEERGFLRVQDAKAVEELVKRLAQKSET